MAKSPLSKSDRRQGSFRRSTDSTFNSTSTSTRNYRTSKLINTTIDPSRRADGSSLFSSKDGSRPNNIFLFLLKQISPGIMLVVCYLGFKSLNRSTQLSLMGYATTSDPPFESSKDQSRPNNRLGSKVPNTLQYLGDLSTPFNPRSDIPYFWDIHFAGESIAESIFAKCHFLIQACEHGLRQPNFNDEKLEVFEDQTGALFVNVDLSTRQGVKRAATLGLSEQRLAEVVISPLIHLVSSKIFSFSHKGRFFALFRHPIQRAISMFNYLGTASWDPMYNPDLKTMTLVEYSTSGSVEHNWMTRFLIDKHGGKLTKEDIVAAKEILRTKCLVGLFDDMEASLVRFQMYFGWSPKQPPEQVAKCRTAVLQAGDPRTHHETVEKGSPEWNALAIANQYDMEIFEYAKLLYRLQGEQIFEIPPQQQSK